MEEEIWKTIIDFPQYQVSNFGRVMSYKNPKKPILMKGRITKGYKYIHLRDINGKGYSKQLHRLVLETFCPVENMKNLEVNHIDENKLNNNLENLEWLTHEQNVAYGTGRIRAHISQSDQILCVETGIIYNSMREASEQTGTNYGNLSRACKTGRLCNGFHWENLTNKRKKTA